ncbi:SGNH/GDSL hydrolase family protein [Aquamicrobium terrae]
MGQIADAFRHAFRDFVTDGVPASGKNNPAKSEIRPIGQMIEQAIGDGTGNVDAKVEAEREAREQAVSDLEAADAALSARIDAVQGAQRKEPVTFATTGNITLSGSQTIDGVGTGNGQRGLVMNQTNAAQNGIYVTNSSGAWTRATDADTEAELLGAMVYVTGGAVNGGLAFGLATKEPIVVGTTDLLFVQTSGDPEGLAGAVSDLEDAVTASTDEIETARRGTQTLASGIEVAIPGRALRRLKEAVSDPLTQYVGIVAIGDSITWGSGASNPGTSTPRDGTLADPRANYDSPNFVNLLKRYLQETYRSGPGSSESIGNWPASPSGQSDALYQKISAVYPRYGKFTVSNLGATAPISNQQDSRSPTYMVLGLPHNIPGQDYGHQIAFPFTGSMFTLSVRITQADLSMFFDVLVNDVVVQTVNAQEGNNGLVVDAGNFDQQIPITLPAMVHDGVVKIRTKRNGLSGNRYLNVTALRIPRRLSVRNQGINGATTVSYLANNMAGNPNGHGVAVPASDRFVFIQLGVNDRGRGVRPNGVNQFYENLNALLDNAALDSKEVILMISNPVENEDPATYSFTQQEVRNVIYQVGRERDVDVIDNYAIFRGMDFEEYTTDGLHPNDLGHSMIAENVIRAIEGA